MLESEADLGCAGGAAGSLKTSTLMVDAIQEKNRPWGGDIRAVLIRKTYPELEEIIERARPLYSEFGGTYNEAAKTWKFPEGAIVRFRHLDNEKKDLWKFYGFEYSWIGIDESTAFTENAVRKLLTRNRAVNPKLKVRMRLATNPGNLGSDWHKKLFLKGFCPHCHPTRLQELTSLRWDARWPSDGEMIGNGIPNHPDAISVQFIPGNISDHNLLGQRYIKLLKTQNPATAKALLSGCWEQFEGQYFKCWDAKRMVIPNWLEFAEEIKYRWWWPHFVSADYGFSISEASAHLHCIMPPYDEQMSDGTLRHWSKGRVLTIGEILEAQKDCEEFTNLVVKRWLLDEHGKLAKTRFHGFYLSPDSWAKSGMKSGVQGIYSRAEQMNAILSEYGHTWEPAANDREGGAVHMYTSLNSGEWLIAGDRCPKAIEAIPSRIHDPDRPDDVLKIKGSPLDDVYDDLRYGLYTHRAEERQPIEERIEEATEGKDPMNAMLISMKMTAEEAKENEPVVFGGKASRQNIAGRRPKNLFPGF